MTFKEKFKEINWKILYADKLFLINLILSLIFIIGALVILSLQFRPQEEPVILHYNIYFGIDLIGDWWRIYGLPLFGFITFFINFTLSVIIYQKEKVISYFLIHISSLIQIILLVSCFFISLQNL